MKQGLYFTKYWKGPDCYWRRDTERHKAASSFPLLVINKITPKWEVYTAAKEFLLVYKQWFLYI